MPSPPLNMVGDFGGGALYLALGIVSGILEARSSGKGQVVDAAMVEAAAHMMTAFHGLRAAGMWNLERGTNVIDSGAFFYDCFECRDGKIVSVAAIEPKFFGQLLRDAARSIRRRSQRSPTATARPKAQPCSRHTFRTPHP